MIGIGKYLALCLVCVASLMAGCAGNVPPQTIQVTPPMTSTGDAEPAGAEEYLIAVGDELEIRFPDHPERTELVRVRPDGYVTLGAGFSLRAEGKTPGRFQQDVLENMRRQMSDAAEGREKTYRIRPSDQFDVVFPYQPSFNQSVVVGPDGKVSLLLIKMVTAEGKSPEALQQELAQRYGQFLKVPELSVVMKRYSSQSYYVGNQLYRADAALDPPVVIVRGYTPLQVFVGGEVARPSALEFRRNLTLMQAIIAAGGKKPGAEMRGVVVLRKTGGGEPKIIRRDLLADLDGDVTNDILLRPYDVVVVPKTQVAALAESLEQHLFNLLPPLKNSAFSFIYNIRRDNTTTLVAP